MDLQNKQVAHFFAGAGGSVSGMEAAGWNSRFAVEVDKDRCETLRKNFPKMKVFEGPIQKMTLKDYPEGYLPVHFDTFPCQNYTDAAKIHGHWDGDSLYLEALREAVMLWPEIIVIENVLGMRKFPRVMETWRSLPHYHTTEFELHGEDFTHQQKARVFLILHRQAYEFPSLDQYIKRIAYTHLGQYLDANTQPVPLLPYIVNRINGAYRDPAYIYDPQQTTPVPLFANYKRDRSNYLVKDISHDAGVRPFSVSEVARLHGFPEGFQFKGSLTSQYAQIIDAVMPPMAEALGLALNDYFAAIPSLATQPKAKGHRQVISARNKPAVVIPQVPLPDPSQVEQISLWNASQPVQA